MRLISIVIRFPCLDQCRSYRDTSLTPSFPKSHLLILMRYRPPTTTIRLYLHHLHRLRPVYIHRDNDLTLIYLLTHRHPRWKSYLHPHFLWPFLHLFTISLRMLHHQYQIPISLIRVTILLLLPRHTRTRLYSSLLLTPTPRDHAREHLHGLLNSPKTPRQVLTQRTTLRSNHPGMQSK